MPNSGSADVFYVEKEFKSSSQLPDDAIQEVVNEKVKPYILKRFGKDLHGICQGKNGRVVRKNERLTLKATMHEDEKALRFIALILDAKGRTIKVHHEQWQLTT